MGESRKNPFPGRRGVKHLLDKQPLKLKARRLRSASYLAYHKAGGYNPKRTPSV